MSWFQQLANIFRPGKLRSEIDEEFQYHIEARIADNVADGMSPEEARADALGRFGGRTLTLDRVHDADTAAWLGTALQDLRYGVRNMRSNPMVTVVALLCLALAMGASTAIFSVVDAVLLRALPYKQPDRLTLLWMSTTLNGSRVNASISNFDDWKARTRTFETGTALLR